MSYTVSQKITDELSFVCSDGDISLVISHKDKYGCYEDSTPVHLFMAEMYRRRIYTSTKSRVTF